MNEQIQEYLANLAPNGRLYRLSLMIACEENPDLTLDEVLELVKAQGTDEHDRPFEQAAEMLREHANELGIKT